MNILIYPTMILAALGLVLSLIVHMAALFGLPVSLPFNAMSLHTGVFVVWIHAMFVSYPAIRKVPRQDQWQAMLRGCLIGFVISPMAFLLMQLSILSCPLCS